jgi:hypothetical protein
MPIPMPASAVLDRYFLDMRSRILEVGAALDRVDRAEGGEQTAEDERLARLREAIRVLADGRPDRAERIQMIFSDDYADDWSRPSSRTT